MTKPTHFTPALHQPASRRSLLQTCATRAVLALLVSAGTAGVARAQDTGTPCGAANNSPCYILWQGTNQPEAPNSGGTGQTGGQAADALHGFLTAQTYEPTGPTFYAPIFVGSVGGSGGDGRGTHTIDDNGGGGGAGGNGGTASISMAAGVTVNTSQMAILPSPVTDPTQAGVVVFSQGGPGGAGALSGHQGTNGVGGTGGTAEPVSAVSIDGTINTTVAGLTGLYAGSIGGQGGVGNSHLSSDDNDSGADGGTGGDGNNVTVVFSGNITAAGAGLYAASAGGDGGVGGTPITIDVPVGAQGGTGGGGGAAGTVFVTTEQGSTITTDGSLSPAIWARSLGGAGGAGGQGTDDASGGNAGTGDIASAVTVTSNGLLTTNGESSPAILAQSFGGSGANGGKGGGWGAGGGDGGYGAPGGTVEITSTSIAFTSGANSSAIVAQSIGGSGGYGGDGSGFATVGGSGANAADGGQVTVNLLSDSRITTTGERSAGVLAQSIGGGGGNGGNATSTAIGPVNMTVGGDGGKGGDAAEVDVSQSGVIGTEGLHSPGIVLQSIGGGGGNGGAAYGKTTGVQLTVQDSIGGNGGVGGDGGTIGEIAGVVPTNTGQIVTTGADSYGLVGQSIGGGGGNGGASAATAKSYGLSEDAPNVALTIAIGGQGGAAGTGGVVTLGNSGLIATRGSGAVGMVAQSIGGGGGTGGDSSATSTAVGSDSPVNIAGSVSLGGKGGAGGAGGNITATNGGVILTTGESADGMLVQSIGGGGGAGGSGDGQSKTQGGDNSITTAVNLGGDGGAGNGSGEVTAENDGAILTLGDGAAGMVVEGIGGGGGRGGGGAGSAGGATFSATVTIGGSGGNGGGTVNAVNAINTGSIVTFGADAAGIVAQSIGGGGGDGGKAGTSIGTSKSITDGGNAGSGSATSDNIVALQTAFLASGSGKVTSYYTQQTNLINLGIYLLGGTTTAPAAGLRAVGDSTDGLEDLGENAGDNDDENESTSITAKVTLGGAGGKGGDAGPVTVTTSSSSSIGTAGAMSDGIIAQSIGGGGGKGGAASTATSSGDVQTSVAVGGSGGAGGDGNTVTVNNDGNLETVGGDSVGILAQSIGGGGGEGGVSGAKTGALEGVALSLGGTGGAAGNGNTVTITNSATIETHSHDGIGILAQSIGAGGGVVKTLSTDASDNNGGGAVTVGGTYDVGLTFGGGTSKDTNSGTGGNVNVTNNFGAAILTNGANAFGILAQSIGGGGGVMLGGQVATNNNLFGAGQMVGDANYVTITQNGTIITQGAGASAIIAQSIGGGGGLGGNFGSTMDFTPMAQSTNHNGNGGPVTINVGAGAVMQTNGANAPVIFAQSIGGGGGQVASATGAALNGTAGGQGYGSTINVTVGSGAQVIATGTSSIGIYAESTGYTGTGDDIFVTIGQGATVSGGHSFYSSGPAQYTDSAGIEIVNGQLIAEPSIPANSIDNSGTITSAAGAAGIAILNNGGVTVITNEASGVIIGSILLNVNGGEGNVINNGGSITPGPTISLGGGTLTNAGVLDLRRAGGAVTLSGNYVGTTNGAIVVGADFGKQTADHLTVTGDATLNPTTAIKVDSTTWRKSAPVTVVTVDGSLNAAASLSASPVRGGYALGLTTLVEGNTVRVQPVSNLLPAAATLSPTAARVATSLDGVWNSGADLGNGFTALSAVGSSAELNAAMNSVAGSAVRGIAATRQAASERFFDNLTHCDASPNSALPLQESTCSWMRVVGAQTNLASSDGDPGYHQTATTYQLGGQYEFSPGWFAGASLGFEQSWLNGGGASVSGQSGLAGLMIKRQTGPWLLTGEVDGGYGSYNSSRAVDVGSESGSATASPKVANLGGHLQAAYQVALAGGFYAQPSFTLGALYTEMPQYSEAGSSSFRLNVHGSSTTTLSASPMVEFGAVGNVAGHAVRGFVDLGMAAYSNSDWSGTANLELAPAGTGSFTVDSKLPSVVGKGKIGADIYAGGGFDVKLVYTADAASGFLAQAVLAKLSYNF